jgi:hypothetical protein
MPTPWTTPLLRRACEIEPANLSLAFAPRPADRHYAALALRGFERAGDAAAFPAFARLLPFRKRRDLLASLHGADLGNPALLGRCGPRIWSRQAYDRFARIAADPARRAALAGHARLSPAVLATIESLPAVARDAKALPLVQALGASDLGYLLTSLRAQRSDLDDRAILRALGRWRIDEIQGVGNARVPPRQRRAAVAPFVAAGFPDVEGDQKLLRFIGSTWFYP